MGGELQENFSEKQEKGSEVLASLFSAMETKKLSGLHNVNALEGSLWSRRFVPPGISKEPAQHLWPSISTPIVCVLATRAPVMRYDRGD